MILDKVSCSGVTQNSVGVNNPKLWPLSYNLGLLCCVAYIWQCGRIEF